MRELIAINVVCIFVSGVAAIVLFWIGELGLALFNATACAANVASWLFNVITYRSALNRWRK